LKRTTYFEIDLPRCANTYGVSPCTATVGADSPDTGTDKCFNSRASCQDLPNFRLGLPEVESITESTFAVDASSHVVLYPDTAAGDLLILFLAFDNTPFVTPPADWTFVDFSNNGDTQITVWVRIATGSEGASSTFTTSTSESGAAHVYRILKNNWAGILNPFLAVEMADGGTTDSPDPASLASGFGEDVPILWIAAVASGTATSADDYPDGFKGGVHTVGGSGASGTALSSAHVVLTGQDEVDPGPFTLSSSVPTATATVAIKGGAGPAKLRFASPADYLPPSIEALPNIRSIDHKPAIIGLGDDLGERASLTVSFEDTKHPDSGPGYDKYLADRSYDPLERGTWAGKFRARHPYLQGADCRLIRGDSDDLLENMETRRFIIESVSGPDQGGTLVITGIGRKRRPLQREGFSTRN
jgi:hypothetical protein